MSISNNLEEISTCIVCPQCKHDSPKYWTVNRLETKGKPKEENQRYILDALIVTILQRYLIRNWSSLLIEN